MLSILAAAIVLVITTQSIDASRTASNQSDSQTASQAAADTRRSVETWLASSPYVFLSTVSPYEDARVCTTGVVVQPGSTWPASCGTSWTYTTPSNLSAGGTVNSSSTLNSLDGAVVEVQLQAPSSASPFLHVDIVTHVGQYSAGLSLVYRMHGSEGYTVYSTGDLHLDSLANGCTAACSTISGSLYTDGSLYLPSSSAVTISANTQLETETGFSPAPPSTSTALYYSPNPVPGTTSTAPILNIRTVAPAQLTLADLRAAAARTSALACPSAPAIAYPSDSALTSLCLSSGAAIPALYDPATGSAGTVTVPTGVTAYLFLFDQAATSPARADTVSIYYATSPITPAGNCAASCDLLSVSAADVAANQSPGEFSFWSPNLLGVFAIPRSGLVYSPVDAYLSLCGSAASNAAWTTLNGSCPALSAGYTAAGMTVGQSTTIIAGSPSAPANVWLSGSIAHAPGVSFGAVAYGSVLIPYWARPPGTAASTDLALSGAYTALGYGQNSSSAIQTFPASVDTTIADNVSNSLNLDGSLAAPSVSLAFNMFSQASLQSSAQLAQAPPPYFTDFDGAWQLVSQAVLATASS